LGWIYKQIWAVTEHDHEPNPKHSTPFHSRAQGTLLQPFLNLTLIILYIHDVYIIVYISKGAG